MGLSEADEAALDNAYGEGYQEGYEFGKKAAVAAVREEFAVALKSAYTERARLLAYIATWHNAHVGFNDPEEADWPLLTIETGQGQMTWHIAPEDAHLLSHIRHTDEEDRGWDGHTTQEKYARLERLIESSGEEV